MAATVTVREWNGTSGSEVSTDKTSGTVRAKNADNATVDANNPLVRPASSSDYSFLKYLRLHIGGTGPSGTISNLELYSDGTNNYGTGITIWIKTTNPGSYSTPVKATTTTGFTDIFTYSSGSRKDMDVAKAGPFSGTNIDIGDYAQMFMEVASTATAPQNPTSSETITFSWDET